MPALPSVRAPEWLTAWRGLSPDGPTAHGLRSTFSDWCAEATAFPAEAREMALAHVIRNRAEAAYRRGDLLEKRREMMAAWSGFLDGRA